MSRLLGVACLVILLAVSAACVRRMAAFAPHRTNTEAHRTAGDNQACLGCHELRKIGGSHGSSDNCFKCHRILQGE